MKLSKGIQFFAGSTQTTYDLTKLNLSAGNYAITVVAEAEGFTDSDVSNSVNYSVQAQLAAPTIAMNADGKTLEITDVANATSYDVYVDGTLKTNVARPTGYSGTVSKTGGGIVYYEINKDTITSHQSLTQGQHSFTGVVSFYCESGKKLYDISIINTVNCGAVTHNIGYLITPTADNFSFTIKSEINSEPM